MSSNDPTTTRSPWMGMRSKAYLYSPQAGAITSAGPKGITATDLIAALDAAGIQRAVVLSVAYVFSNPNRPPIPDEYAHVKAENDWTSAQVAKYPGRLVGFCGVNPLRPFALDEIARCAKDPNLRTGLKLHLGNSDVQVDNPEHLAQLTLVFHAANVNRMAIAVHMHANVDHKRPYGEKASPHFSGTSAPGGAGRDRSDLSSCRCRGLRLSDRRGISSIRGSDWAA